MKTTTNTTTTSTANDGSSLSDATQDNVPQKKDIDTQTPPKSPSGNFSQAPDGSDAEANKAAQQRGIVVPVQGASNDAATAPGANVTPDATAPSSDR